MKTKLVSKGLSIKDVRSQGGGDLSSADILQTREVFLMQTSALFGVKNFGFFKIFSVFTDMWEGLEPVRTREKGVNFCDFVPTSFMDGP